MSSSNVIVDPIASGGSYFDSKLLGYADRLKVAHMNCQSISPSRNSVKFDELVDIVRGKFDLIGITETWLKPCTSDSAVHISGYNLVRNDRVGRRGGGVCIFVSNKLKYRVVSNLSLNGCESLFIEVFLNGVSLLFGVVYLPYGDIVEFENSHYELFLEYSKIITVGDFNCNMFDTTKSYLFRSMSMRFDLSVFHNSRPTYYDVAHNSTSLLDFWMTSKDLLFCFSDQVACPSISHHSLIFAVFSVDYVPIDNFVEYRDFNRIDFEGLLSYIARYDSVDLFGSTSVEYQCSVIQSLIDDLFTFVPMVRRRLQGRDNCWIKSRSIVLATSLRDLAYSAFRLNRCAVNWSIYCRYRNKAKSLIRREKRRFYCRMFSGLGSSGIWRILRYSGLTVGNRLDADFNTNDINEFFVDGSNGPEIDSTDLSFEDYSPETFSFRCIDEGELFDAICKIKSKSVGVDAIPIRFIRTIYPYISHILTFHVNTILTTSVFPAAWKLSRVVPIPKSSRVCGLNDLRPISILPSLSKAVEHIMKDQILHSVRNNVAPSQYAFRRNHNTTSLLLAMTDDMRKHLNNGYASILVSLDLTKAFNCINYTTLIGKLRELFHFSNSACRLIYSYLSGRSQFVDYNGQHSNILCLHSGVPQGSVLGPLLFILYINDLPNFIDSAECKSFLFADDVMLVFNDNRSNAVDLCSRVNLILERLTSWMSSNSLTINLRKTKALVVGVPDRFLPDLNIIIDGSPVDFVDHVKCLGIFIDKRLTFDHHVHYLQSKIFGILRRLYSANLYLPFRVRRQLAHSLMMSSVLYGLEVFSGTFSYVTSQLNRIVNMIVRYVFLARRRDHISGLVRRFLGCSFYDFIGHRNLFFFYKIIKYGLPSLLCSKFSFTRSTRNPQILLPRINSVSYEKSFTVRVARYWNQLPFELRVFSHSNNVFRLKLMRFLSN